MEYRHLGTSGLLVSELAYGNWLTHASQVEEDTARECVAAALDGGITTFDTADIYAGTQAESVLGKLLSGQRRDGLEIFTKVYWPTGPGRNDVGLSRKHIIRSCENSLKRLRTDYIDLYQAHRYDVETPLEETLRAFDDLIRSGKVLYVGVSEWTAEQISEAVRIADDLGLDRIVSNQPQYSILWRVIEAEVIPACQRRGIGQVVWSPLAQGILTGKYLPDSEIPPGSRAASKEGHPFMRHWLGKETLERVQQLMGVASEAGLTLPQLALAWVLRNPAVSSAIIGATNSRQVRDNIGAVGVRLDEATVSEIDRIVGDIVVADPASTQSPTARP
ncbi:MAG: aldo/keto reductase family protein [Candidatus Nanopelagicales bacterium]|nr:aldo/keto reductase family protein [Candidatus Nanopelagicales bacterium]